MKNKCIVVQLIIFTILFAIPSRKNFSDAFINVAENANPAIVSIISEKEIEMKIPHFFYPFGEFPNETYKGQSLGSGVIIDAWKGYIVTNNHVIEDAENIKVVLLDNRELRAEVIGADPLSDIALIKVEDHNLKDIKMGDSDDLKVGEWVMAIGSPFGLHLNHTVTAGIISATGRSEVISSLNFEDFIQHDAAINPGNSGGALLDLDGNLIGINTAIATGGQTRSNAGVGFAIPINQVKRVIEDLIENGYVIRGWLGVSIQDINDRMSKALNMKNRNGAIISQIMEGSPAEVAGLIARDIIIKVDSKPVKNASELKILISSGHPNDKVSLTIIRNELQSTVSVTLGTRPNQDVLLAGNYSTYSKYDIIGLIVEDHENGVIVTYIKDNSTAAEQNIKKGDIINAVGRKVIKSTSDYLKTLEIYSVGDIIMLQITRNKNVTYIAFEIY